MIFVLAYLILLNRDMSIQEKCNNDIIKTMISLASGR